MGIGSYNFSALQEIQSIAFRALEKFTPKQIVRIGLQVDLLIAGYRVNHPDRVPRKTVGLLGSVVPVDDFALALHLANTGNPDMAKIEKAAKGLPVLLAYLSVVTSSPELPPDSFLDSALPFAIACLSVDGEIAKSWNQNLQNKVSLMTPLANKGKQFSNGRKLGSFGPVATAVMKRLLKKPNESADEIWMALSLKPPRGMTFYGQGKKRSDRRIETESLKEPSRKLKVETSMWGGLGDKTQTGKRPVITPTEWARFRAIVIEQKEVVQNCTE